MTPEEMQAFGKKRITITREEVAEIIAVRISEEEQSMKASNLDPIASLIFKEIITNICADIMHEMFGDEERLEVE